MLFGAGERPGVFVTPDVVAHDENAHGFFFFDAVIDPFQVVVHPAEDDFVVVHRSGFAEVAVARVGAFQFAVRPRSDDGCGAQMRFGFARGKQTVEVRGGAVGAVGLVVPAGNVENG